MKERTVFLNGRYMPEGEASISPMDRGFLFGDGLYEVVRAYRGKFLEVDAHANRIRAGLKAMSYGDTTIDFAGICRGLREANELGSEDSVYYLQVTRGAPETRSHAFPDSDPEPTVFATVFPYQRKADPEIGVKAVTVPDIRWTRCDVKTTQLLANCMSQTRAKRAGAFEAILIRDGVALESSASSFFAVIDGVVRTAPLSNYILPSITRRIVLDLCREQGIAAEELPVLESELAGADELFFAGTTLEVLPIVECDGRPVSGGAPGPVSQSLRTHFAEYVDRHARP